MTDDQLATLVVSLYAGAIEEKPHDRLDAVRRVVAAVGAIRTDWSASEARAFVQRTLRPN